MAAAADYSNYSVFKTQIQKCVECDQAGCKQTSKPVLIDHKDQLHVKLDNQAKEGISNKNTNASDKSSETDISTQKPRGGRKIQTGHFLNDKKYRSNKKNAALEQTTISKPSDIESKSLASTTAKLPTTIKPFENDWMKKNFNNKAYTKLSKVKVRFKILIKLLMAMIF